MSGFTSNLYLIPKQELLLIYSSLCAHMQWRCEAVEIPVELLACQIKCKLQEYLVLFSLQQHTIVFYVGAPMESSF